MTGLELRFTALRIRDTQKACPLCKKPTPRQDLDEYGSCVPCAIDAFYASRAGTPDMSRGN